MLNLFLATPIKDSFIVVTVLILAWCILEIRKLKKTIVREVHKRIIPQLALELIPGFDVRNVGLYLENESSFVARDIAIEDTEFALDDFGFRQNLILKFENNIGSLKPKERVKLRFKVYKRINNELEYQDKLTQGITPHLISPAFKVKVCYYNIEGLKCCILFGKSGEKFFVEEIETF